MAATLLTNPDWTQAAQWLLEHEDIFSEEAASSLHVRLVAASDSLDPDDASDYHQSVKREVRRVIVEYLDALVREGFFEQAAVSEVDGTAVVQAVPAEGFAQAMGGVLPPFLTLYVENNELQVESAYPFDDGDVVPELEDLADLLSLHDDYPFA